MTRPSSTDPKLHNCDEQSDTTAALVGRFRVKERYFVWESLGSASRAKRSYATLRASGYYREEIHDILLCNVMVVPKDARGQGIATLGLPRVLATAAHHWPDAKTASVVPLITTHPSLTAWYARQGFQPTRPDASCLRLTLSDHHRRGHLRGLVLLV